MNRGFAILLLSVLAAVSSIYAVDMNAGFEITASKPRHGAQWLWHADIVNLYQGDSTLVNGSNIYDGDRIEVDLLSFPSNEGAWQELFRLDYETNALVTTKVSISASSFIGASNPSDSIPVKFRFQRTYSLDVPQGASLGYSPQPDGEDTGIADGLYSLGKSWDVVSVQSPVPITGPSGECGYFSHQLVVSGRLAAPLDGRTLAEDGYVMPVSVVITLEGE